MKKKLLTARVYFRGFVFLIGFSLFILVTSWFSIGNAQISNESLSDKIKGLESQGWKVTQHKVPFEDYPEAIVNFLCDKGLDCFETYYFERKTPGGCNESKVVKVQCTFSDWNKVGLDACMLLGSRQVETQEVLAPKGGSCDKMGSSPSTTPTPQKVCQVSPNEEQKRQEIFSELASKYKFKVQDSNICEKQSCVDNRPWSVEELTIFNKTINDLPQCFIGKLDLSGISGIREGDSGNLFTRLGEEISKNLCCPKDQSKEKGYSFYWGVGYNRIIFCGDNYKNLPYSLGGILAHEMTHAYQNCGEVIQPNVYNCTRNTSWMKATDWLCLPFVGCQNSKPEEIPTAYAKKMMDPLEDMAESVRLYYESPQELKTISPARYDFVKNNIMCGKEFTAQ